MSWSVLGTSIRAWTTQIRQGLDRGIEVLMIGSTGNHVSGLSTGEHTSDHTSWLLALPTGRNSLL